MLSNTRALYNLEQKISTTQEWHSAILAIISFFKKQHLQTLSLSDVSHQLLYPAVSSAAVWRPQIW